MIKRRSAGEVYKPTATVKKSKKGVPTKIEINGVHYVLQPSQENFAVMTEQIKRWERLNDAR
jgi:hypothetical protein